MLNCSIGSEMPYSSKRNRLVSACHIDTVLPFRKKFGRLKQSDKVKDRIRGRANKHRRNLHTFFPGNVSPSFS